jgi:hypothetical protein
MIRELPPSDAERRERVFAGRAGSQSPHEVEPPGVRRHLHVRHGKRRSHIDVSSGLRTVEVGRRNAKDRERPPLDVEHSPDHTRVAAKPALPIAMTDDGDRLAILLRQRAARDGMGTDHRVIVSRHPLDQRELGLAVHRDMRVGNRAKRREP